MTGKLVLRLRLALRGLVPVTATFALVLIAVVPLGIPYFAPVTPLFTVMAVYYWTIYRPDLLPSYAVFAAGLMQDVLSGEPVGLMALVLLLVHGVCLSQRRVLAGKSFLVGWFGFSLVAAGAAFVSWLLVSIYYTQLVDPLPGAVQLGASVALYPVLAHLFGLGEQRMLRPL